MEFSANVKCSVIQQTLLAVVVVIVLLGVANGLFLLWRLTGEVGSLSAQLEQLDRKAAMAKHNPSHFGMPDNMKQRIPCLEHNFSHVAPPADLAQRLTDPFFGLWSQGDLAAPRPPDRQEIWPAPAGRIGPTGVLWDSCPQVPQAAPPAIW